MVTLLIAIACVLLVAIIVLIIAFRPKATKDHDLLQRKIEDLQSGLLRLEKNLREEASINGTENAATAKDNRTELSDTIKDFKIELSSTLRNITEQNQNALKEINSTLELKIDALVCKIEEKLTALNSQAQKESSLSREAISTALKAFGENYDKNIRSFNDVLKEKFSHLETKQNDLVRSTEQRLDGIRATVEEKLEKTLSDRIGQSFDTVGKHLIEVQKGLGEMQTIASDVGGLKKVLSNVKLRGGIGEVQLAMLLEQILAPNQYDANVRTKQGSMDAVEFAIKLPGHSEDEGSIVYLPVDAKFPKDSYEHLINAYDRGAPEEVEIASKNLEATIRKMAKDIRDKYVDPPNTTDFAIMFLPFESIYAEVIRRSSLVDQLRDEHKITVAGPTTLMAILNSLQMGFRTLALQKRSSEVWHVLAGVKTEFENFGGMLQKAQKNIQTGLGQLDDVVGKRTRAIQRKLKDVQSLPAAESAALLTGLPIEIADPEE